MLQEVVFRQKVATQRVLKELSIFVAVTIQACTARFFRQTFSCFKCFSFDLLGRINLYEIKRLEGLESD